MVESSVEASSGPAHRSQPVRRGSFDTLIPRPSWVMPGDGGFVLSDRTAVVVETALASSAVERLRDHLRPATGFELPLVDAVGGEEGTIRFREARALGTERYELSIRPGSVDVVAAEAAGFSWAVETIRQVLPPEIESRQARPGTWMLPAGVVRDGPRFPWRGVMLDVARHFFGPADVERVVDLLAAYKMNRLHLHLSDDQGWRLEIERHPELTAVGGRTAVGGGRGGHYTQEEYRNIVAYAAERGVVVVPEVDMPGHTHAVLASIPALNRDGVAPEPYTGVDVGFSSLCVDREATYAFVDDVIAELAALTPGPYIHIGGDESDATEAHGYREFVERVAGIVRSHGKVPLGWEEIATADLASDVVVQHWRWWDNATTAARKGARLVMSPASRAYLDMKYDPSTPLGTAWAGHVDTRKAYEWDPATRVPGLPAEAVLGVEAPLWTETVGTLAEIEQMMLPRLPGHAELGWSPPDGRTWDGYCRRLAAHAARWTVAGRAFTQDPSVPWPSATG